MDIRQLQYLIALAREQHFTRAAAACNVTQPTLSGRIRQLEQELGVPIVARGQRFQGLTPEGERVLKWAKLMLKTWSAMKLELDQLGSDNLSLSGRLSIGAIPSALPVVPRLTGQVRRDHPNIDFSILSMSSAEILRGLEEFTIDVGITYLDGEPLGGLLTTELYIEHYALYLPVGHRLTKASHVSWKNAADLELGLLSSNMQNRRIIDRAFRAAKCQPKTVLETNSVINLWSNVRQMGLATIMPQHIINIMGRNPGLVAVPLVDPVVAHTIGMVTLDREPVGPLVKVLRAAAKNFSQSDQRTTTVTDDAISSSDG